MPNFEQLIPELRMCKANIDSWIKTVGRFDHAIGYGQVFWPEFKIHSQCVLFANCPDDAFDQWMKHTEGDLTAVECVLNHRHILDLFVNSEFEASRDVVLYLGRLLRDMWSCKLARNFAGRTIVVSFDEAYREELVDYEITVFHKR